MVKEIYKTGQGLDFSGNKLNYQLCALNIVKKVSFNEEMKICKDALMTVQ